MIFTQQNIRQQKDKLLVTVKGNTKVNKRFQIVKSTLKASIPEGADYILISGTDKSSDKDVSFRIQHTQLELSQYLKDIENYIADVGDSKEDTK